MPQPDSLERTSVGRTLPYCHWKDLVMEEVVSPDFALKAYYERNGCIRIRLDDLDRGCHGGVELRLVVANMAERKLVMASLKELGISHGKVYRKQRNRKQWVVPIYTRADLLKFLMIVQPINWHILIRQVEATIKRKTAAEKNL